MRKVGICGVGHTKFGTYDGTFLEMLSEASLLALDDAGVKLGAGHPIDQVFVASMGASMMNRISGSASALVDTLNIRPAMAECVENGPASGASAIKLGTMAIASGMCDCVLVVGGEKMKSVPGNVATDFVATMLHPEAEYPYGLTLSAFAGLYTRVRMERFGMTLRDLSTLSMKNHGNAMHNPVAQFHKELNMDLLMDGPESAKKNRVVADPLRLYDICPTSDGACAVLLCAEDKYEEFGLKKPVTIAGVASATDTHVVANRADIARLEAVRKSAELAYQMAGKTPADIDVAELHDAFIVLEIAESEEVGLFPVGEGHLAVRRGDTAIGGKVPINTSGGLKAKGHPLGATGISQVIEIVRQLRGEADGRQVEGAKTGLAVNFGGFGNNVVSTILTVEGE